MLADELRNPLAPILDAAQVMRLSVGDPAVVTRMQEVVEQQVRHLARLVDDLLDVLALHPRQDPAPQGDGQREGGRRPGGRGRPSHDRGCGLALSIAVAAEPILIEADPRDCGRSSPTC